MTMHLEYLYLLYKACCMPSLPCGFSGVSIVVLFMYIAVSLLTIHIVCILRIVKVFNVVGMVYWQSINSIGAPLKAGHSSVRLVPLGYAWRIVWKME